jgi:hypothetical protein
MKLLDGRRKELERKMRAAHLAQLASHPRPELAVAALQVEYTSLRQESLASIGHRIQIVGFTVAAIAVSISALFRASNGIAASVFCITLPPLVSFAACLIWLGEYQRSQRAGRGLIEIERSINAVLGGGEVVLWETSLARNTSHDPVYRNLLTDAEEAELKAAKTELEPKGRGSHMAYPYRAALAIIFSAGVGSQVAGFVRLAQDNRADEYTELLITGSVASALVDLAFLLFWRRRWREAFRHDTESRLERSKLIVPSTR